MRMDLILEKEFAKEMKEYLCKENENIYSYLNKVKNIENEYYYLKLEEREDFQTDEYKLMVDTIVDSMNEECYRLITRDDNGNIIEDIGEIDLEQIMGKIGDDNLENDENNHKINKINVIRRF